MLANIQNILIVALAASPLVAAHGKVTVMTCNVRGNGTAIGILGGIVQGDGPNQKTEPDTTIFDQVKIATDGLGRTNAGGANTVAKVADTMVLSGPVLPQGSATKGHCNGIWHTVVTDGAGPVRVMIDPTATGKFSTGTEATVTIQVPGKGGEIPPPKQRRFLPRTLIKMGLLKRASNVDEDSPIAFDIPDGTTCTGVAAGLQKVCFAKIANDNGNGPFGGVVAFQISDDGVATPATTGTKATKNTQRDESFIATTFHA